jgi:phage terminase large subunit GpA-like protein
VSEWADDNRILPRGSAEPGPWRTSRTPYLREIMGAAIDPRVKRVVLVAGSQLGKTELLLNLIGYRMDIDPAPILFISASQRQAESISTGRVMPMIKSTPALLDKLDTSRQKLKITEKFIAGQRLGFGWAGSAVELSSHPAHTVLIDERDRMASDIENEGDPVALAEARTATYSDGKVVVVSTPTLEGASPIWDLYIGGTMHRWTCPCPECLTFFAPEFALLKWAEKATPQQAKKTARLACPHCGALIIDKHRSSMNAAGKFQITGDAESDCASFWISGLASPWRSWGEAAKQWVEAARSGEPGRCQAVKNTTFGELFLLEGDRPTTETLTGLVGAYQSGEVPGEARAITCGVDMQADRLVYAVRAWGPKSTSWLIRHGEIFGETDQAQVWEQLADLLGADYGALKMRLMLVDSGFRPDAAYAFARRFPGRVYASKGHDGQAKPVNIAKIEVDARGKSSRRGVQLAHVDASYFKSWIHGRIAWPIGEPGAWHLPANVSTDYMEQILAESRVVKKSGQVIWVRARKANHYLDCEVLNAAAGHLLGVHTIKAAKPAASSEQADTATIASAPARAPLPRSRQSWPRSNWTTSWR